MNLRRYSTGSEARRTSWATSTDELPGTQRGRINTVALNVLRCLRPSRNLREPLHLGVL